MENKTVTVLGDAVLDVLAAPVDPGVFEKGSAPVTSSRLYPGGNALNESTVIAKFGLPVQMVTLLGQDMTGQIIQDHCIRHGITLKAAISEAESPVNIVLIDKDGERYFLANNSSTIRRFAKEHIPPVDTDLVCLSDLFCSFALPKEDVSELFAKWKQEGKTTLLDTVRPKHSETAEDLKDLLANVDYLFTNTFEAGKLCRSEDPDLIMATLLGCGANTVLLKLGKEGVLVSHNGKLQKIRAIPNPDCVDTTGCGDNFAGAFIAGLCQNEPFSKCLSQAMAAGSLATEEVGATAAIEKYGLERLHELEQKQKGTDGWAD